jgi:Histidine kinase-, DNA gyrase B-, and HSP90-like ATPase
MRASTVSTYSSLSAHVVAKPKTVAAEVEKAGQHEQDVPVEISYDVIRLLSDHLYASPLKAIEELMVNAWDADANECRIVIPTPDALTKRTADTAIYVWDNGVGMNADTLVDLWRVGTSHKRDDAWVATRKQIGKFGIGKLATYVIARRVTYITRHGGTLRGVTLDYEEFTAKTKADGTTEAVILDQRVFDDVGSLAKTAHVARALDALGLDAAELEKLEHWTLVVLEDLKPKAESIQFGRLSWVLRTALPLQDFTLLLNGDKVESSKEESDWIVYFALSEIEPSRLDSLKDSTGETWSVAGDAIVSDSFPNGITGRVRVSDNSLYKEAAKSEDLGRSHGFFISVHERLINQADPLFGMKPLSFETFNRFIATIEADDLDEYLTAPRDDVEQSQAKSDFRALLLELFNQARSLADQALNARNKNEKEKREGERSYVNPRLLERPLIDALVAHRSHGGSPSDWLLVKADADEASLDQLVDELNQNAVPRRRYTYQYSNRTPAARLVEFDPDACVFTINSDHELVIEYSDNVDTRRLLELLVTAEALLEVYLRSQNIEAEVVAELIERRDQFLRSLAKDEQYSLNAIAKSLRDARDDDKDLEIALVAAARGLGFVARHISYAGQPDGLASYEAYGREGKSFTLEAKSSAKVPSLGAIDFAGLHSHYKNEDIKADGCLLVAPSYPGSSKEEDAEAALRANQQGVSCWTIEDLARVVELAEARHISAEEIENIVFEAFAPNDVHARVEKLLSEPQWIQEELRRAIVEVIVDLQDRLPNSRRTVDIVAGALAMRDTFKNTDLASIGEALNQLAKASKGMLYIKEDGEIFVRGSTDELRRRVAGLTGQEAPPRRQGTLRDRSN